MLVGLLCLPALTWAQEREHSLRAALTNPVTDVVPTLQAVSSIGDWHSSQALFAQGCLEGNHDYTVDGRAPGRPKSEAAGYGVIARQTVGTLGHAVVVQTAAHWLRARLAGRIGRRKATVVYWVAEIGLTAAWSYRQSAGHFRQWQANREAR